MPRTHRVLVIGGGNGGISVAARLRRRGIDDIALVEPHDVHVYQPLLSHVAGGTARASETVRPMAGVIPRGVEWIQDAVTAVDPDARIVTLAGGDVVGYEHLVLSPGIRQDWDAVSGLTAALETPAVTSHYRHDLAIKTSRLLRDLRSGTAVFVQPPGEASCWGAAQKPMYQACAYWRARGVLDDIRVILVVPTPTVFGLPHIDRELERNIALYGIEVRTESELIEVDGAAQEAVVAGPGGAERIRFDVLNVVPPQSAPSWIAASPLRDAADPGAFVAVDPETLRHRTHPDVWAIGDVAGAGNSKSGGALRKQTLVAAENIAAVLAGKAPTARYDGYGVCPFTVSRRTVVWAEFDREGTPKPTIPFWEGMYKEARLSWIFDRRVLPWVYWNMILKGLA